MVAPSESSRWPPGKEIWPLCVSTVSVRRVKSISSPLARITSGISTPARTSGGTVSMLRRTRLSRTWRSRSSWLVAAAVRSMPRRKRAPDGRSECTPRPVRGARPAVRPRAAPTGPDHGSVPSAACACTGRTSSGADWLSLISIILADPGIKRAKHAGRVPAGDHTGRHIVEHHRVDPYYRIATDAHAGEDRDLATDPDVRLDHDRLRLSGPPTILRGLGVGEMIADLARPEDAVGAHLHPVGGDDGAAVQPGIASDVDHGLLSSGDQPVDLRVRPGVDVRLEHHPAGAGDTEPAIAQESRADRHPRLSPVGQGGEPAETACRRLLPIHGLCPYIIGGSRDQAHTSTSR